MLRSDNPDMHWIKGVQDVFDYFETALPKLEQANITMEQLGKKDENQELLNKFDEYGTYIGD